MVLIRNTDTEAIRPGKTVGDDGDGVMIDDCTMTTMALTIADGENRKRRQKDGSEVENENQRHDGH